MKHRGGPVEQKGRKPIMQECEVADFVLSLDLLRKQGQSVTSRLALNIARGLVSKHREFVLTETSTKISKNLLESNRKWTWTRIAPGTARSVIVRRGKAGFTCSVTTKRRRFGAEERHEPWHHHAELVLNALGRNIPKLPSSIVKAATSRTRKKLFEDRQNAFVDVVNKARADLRLPHDRKSAAHHRSGGHSGIR